jgi:hypothetical protein
LFSKTGVEEAPQERFSHEDENEDPGVKALERKHVSFSYADNKDMERRSRES